MDEIQRLRNRIDDLDRDILALLNRRQENAKQLGLLKQAKKRNIRDRSRERIILRGVETAAKERHLNPSGVKNIFREIFRMSIEAQSKPTRNGAALRGKSVLVVGGTGGMGRLFAKFARASGATVKIVGQDKRKTDRVALDIAVTPGSIEDAENSDIVIVAVPLSVIKQISAKVATYMRPRSLLTDLSSVKSGITDEILPNIQESIEYASIHPLFGPSVESFAGQNIAVVSYRTGPQWQSFSRAIRHSGARTHFLTADQHDRTMAKVQALHHFALICLARCLSDWDGELSTNSIRNTLGTVRGLLENWETISGIQQLNPYAQSVRLGFSRVAKGTVDWPIDSKSVKNLSSHVQEWTRKP